MSLKKEKEKGKLPRKPTQTHTVFAMYEGDMMDIGRGFQGPTGEINIFLTVIPLNGKMVLRQRKLGAEMKSSRKA